MITIEDLTPFEKLSLIDMSYSRLDTYEMCHAKYFYTYIQQEPRVFGPAAALGNVVHSVLEEAVGEEFDVFEMHKLFEHYREQFDPDHAIGEDLINVGMEVLTEFVDRHEGEEFDVIQKEMPFAMVVGSGLVSGYIDRVDRTPSGIHIIDYKTGKYEVAAKYISDNLQLGIYALAVSLRFPGEPIRAELYYLRSGRRKSCVYGPEELAVVEEKLREKIEEVIVDRNFGYTDNTRVCSFCDFRKSGVCPVGVKRYGGTE